jgi:hypothetical protein
VKLERAADDADAVREQRRRQGVASKAAILPPVKAEAQRTSPVDVTAGGDALAGHDDTTDAGGRSSGPVAAITWVLVSRKTENHRRQP